MQVTKSGIAFTAKELRALREFGSKEPTDRDKFGVLIELDDNIAYARATNGQAAVQFKCANEGHRKGEWLVDMKFLIDGRKELEGKQVLRLQFKGASLHDAITEENGVERISLGVTTDAAIAQHSFPNLDKDLKLPGTRRERCHCYGLSVDYMKPIQLAVDAVEEEIADFFSPKGADDVLVFQAGDTKATSVIGYIRCGVSAEALKPEDDEDDEGGDEAPKRSKRKTDPRQQDAFETAE